MEVELNVKKTSKVKEVTGAGDWTPEGGQTLYKFNYLMEDGQTLTAQHKTTPSPYPVGSEVDYTIKKVHDTYGNGGTVSKVSDFVPGNKPNYASKSSGGNASFATSYAKDIFNQILIVHGDFDYKNAEQVGMIYGNYKAALDMVEHGAERLKKIMDSL